MRYGVIGRHEGLSNSYIENALDVKYEVKPSKKARFWLGYNSTKLPSSLFPEVRWEDEEPRELTLK